MDLGWFMRDGYAILHCPKEDVPKLAHKIELDTIKDFCFATFPSMPTWCRYCHESCHTKYECYKSKAKIVCFSCDKNGHVAKDCPSPKKTGSKKDRPFKKARKTSNSADTEKTNNKLDKENDAPPPSTEIMKSNWATSDKETVAASKVDAVDNTNKETVTALKTDAIGNTDNKVSDENNSVVNPNPFDALKNTSEANGYDENDNDDEMTAADYQEDSSDESSYDGESNDELEHDEFQNMLERSTTSC